jgi:hypothetical protein
MGLFLFFLRSPFRDLLPVPLALLLLSTPCAYIAIRFFAFPAPVCQIINNYAFASGMLLLYLLPLLSPLRHHRLGFQRRLHEGTMGWCAPATTMIARLLPWC